MKISQFFKKPQKSISNRIASKGGSYSLAISAVVLAILIVVNVFASSLPTTLTNIDISSTKLYSITSNTKVVVNALKKDVTIYWIVQADQEDSIVENLLNKYDSLSDHIDVVKKNPDVYPTFTEKYTSETVPNNSLIVECQDQYRYINYEEDIYLTETDYYGSSYNASFDGEGAITSAIDYVVSEEHPVLYLLEGHGEAELPSTFSEQIEKENMELASFSLLNTDEIPEDADCILIYAPSTDISAEEKEMLAEYVKEGGKMMVLAGPTENGKLENLYTLLEDYGVTSDEGIIVEGNREYYAFQSPVILLPYIGDSEITAPLLEENYYAIMPIAQGLKVGDSSDAVVTELLSTSEEAYNKNTGYEMTTYEKEEGDTEGPFSLAVSIETDTAGQLIWFSSSQFLEDMYNSYSSGANIELAVNSLSSMLGESEAIAIHSKSLNYNYLTISDSSSSYLKFMMIGAFPIAYLGIGIGVILKRRKRNESV